MKAHLPLFAVCALAATATSQGVLGNANTAYELLNVPGSVDADAAQIRFTADSSTASSVAHSFWWYYRIAGDTREYAFNSSGGQLVRNEFFGSIGTLEWADVDGRGIAATSIISIAPTGPTSGSAVHHMTVRNDTAAPITIDLFAYCDIDHCGTAYGDTASGTSERHTVSDPACPGVDAEFFGVLPDHFAVGEWPALLDAMVDGSATTLSDNGLPYSSGGDYTGAMQWTSPTLAPGESFYAVAAISHGTAFVYCGGRASSRNYGTGSGGPSAGVPTITAITQAVVGSNPIFVVENAPPNATGALFYGESQFNGDPGFFIFGLWFYVAVNTEPIFADANGSVRLQLNLPLASGGLCGQKFHFHAFFIDPLFPSPPNPLPPPLEFPLVNSDVLEYTIGM